jgi:hypothetical protein
MVDYGALITGSVVVVALGAFQLVRFIVGRQATTKEKKISVPPPPDHGPCRESVKELTVGLYTFLEESRAGLAEQRSFRQMFGEWLAREEGRRDGQREITGQFRDVSRAREG